MKKIEKVKKYTVYMSDDGTEFSSEYEAKLYEWRKSAKKAYVVYERGQRSDEIEIYSTRENAVQATSSMFEEYSHYQIKEIIVDERIYVQALVDVERTLKQK